MIRLLLNDLWHHKVRTVLTVAAVSLAVSLVVAMTSGFSSIEALAYGKLGEMYGEVDVRLTPRDDSTGLLSTELLQAIQGEPGVHDAYGVLRIRSTVLDKTGQPSWLLPPARVYGLGPDAPRPQPIDKEMGKGRWFRESRGAVAVIDERIATTLGYGVGDHIMLPSARATLRLKIVAIAVRPEIMQHVGMPRVYVPLETLQSFVGEPGALTQIKVDLKPNEDINAFVTWLEARAVALDSPPLNIRTIENQRAKFDRSFQGLELLSFVGGTISLIAAIFIVFSTLTMGVAERSRVLAMLRAIGAQRGQVFLLVLWEGVLLSLLGGAAGVGLGIVWLNSLAAMLPQLFPHGPILNTWGVTYGLGGTLLAALGASIMPAYHAARTDALEAMAAIGKPSSSIVPWLCAAIGLVLVLADSVIVYGLELDRVTRTSLHYYAGLPGVMLGLFLLAPAAVILTERLLSTPIARLLRLEPTLLRQQLSGGLWRTAGTATALMVGLTVFILVRTHGHSMISGWQFPDKFPDLLMIALSPVDDEGVKRLEQVKGIREGELLPVVMVSPKIDKSIFGIGGLAEMPESTIVFGADVERAFGKLPHRDEPMIELDFRQGSIEDALPKLKTGQYVLISEEFHETDNINLGDTIAIETADKRKFEYKVAGVVRAAGIDMIARMFNIETEFQNYTASAMLLDIEAAKRDFKVDSYYMFAANTDYTDHKDKITAGIYEEMGQLNVLAADSRMLKGMIEQILYDLLAIMSTVALLAIVVASLGVTNTILASVRTRRWQFGVLRSIGLTRGALLRLVLAEAMLIGLVACVLGTIGGVLMAFNAGRMVKIIIGHVAPFQIAWDAIAMGVGITVGIAALASAWPAFRTARADTLRLLQSGRATA